jgi:hypothetical protein
MRLGTRQQFLQRGIVQPVQHQHLRTGEKRGIELERRVLRRRAHHRHRPVLHDRQEAVLLGPVEAVDLIHEKQRPLPRLAARPGGVEHFLEVRHTAEDRRHGLEMEPHPVCQQPGDGRLARAGRPPEDNRGEMPGRQHPRKRSLLAQQMRLADHLFQRLRAQLVGERARRPLIHSGCFEKITHARDLSRLPGVLTSARESRCKKLGVRQFAIANALQ